MDVAGFFRYGYNVGSCWIRCDVAVGVDIGQINGGRVCWGINWVCL